MKNSIPLALALACLVLALPARGAASGYEALKREKENYTLPAYPPGYMTESHPEPQPKAATGRVMPDPLRDPPFNRTFYVEEARRLSGYKGDDAWAAALLSKAWDLKDLEALVLLRNAGIRSAALKVQSARDGYSQVSELNDILSRYAAFTEALKPGVGPRKSSPMPNGQFPFPGNMQLKSRVVAADVRMARNSLEKVKRDTITRARTVFWDYVYNQQAIRITGEVIDLLDHLRRVARTKYEAGRTSYYDVVRIDIRVELLKKDRVTLAREKKELETDLLDLLNLIAPTPIVPPKKRVADTMLPSFEAVADLALARRQELDRIQSGIDRMRFMVRTAENMVRPGYSLGFSDFRDRAVSEAGPDAAPGFKTRTMASMGYGAPVKPFSGYLNAWLGQTQTEIRAMEKKLEQEKFSIASRVKKAWVGLDQAIRERDLYAASILGLSRSSLDVALREYEAGRLTFPSVSDAYTRWLDTRLALARIETRIGVYDAKIDQATGLSGVRAYLAQQITGRK